MKTIEDGEIIDLYWARDERAIEKTASKYGGYCYRIAARIVTQREDAEECVNDTYFGAWEAIPPHRPEILSTFLGKIVRRISLKKLRSRLAAKRGGGEAVLVIDELMDCIESGKSVESELESRELAGIIDDFLSSLPKVERQIFVRRYWHMCSVKDICRQFGFSKSKVESMLFRIRGKLLSKLKEEGVFI